MSILDTFFCSKKHCNNTINKSQTQNNFTQSDTKKQDVKYMPCNM